MRYKVEEHEEAGLLPDDSVHKAKIVSVDEIEDKFDRKKKVAFKVKLSAPDTEWDGLLYTGKAQLPLSSHPNNRLRQWAETLLGHELPVNYELDTDVFVGMDCRVVIGLFEKDDDKNPGQMFRTNFVSDFLPALNAVHADAF